MDAIFEFIAGVFLFGIFGFMILSYPILLICDIVNKSNINEKLGNAINLILICVYVIAIVYTAIIVFN